MMKFIVSIILLFLSGIYIWIWKKYRYWGERKVPFVNPTSLIFGNEGELFLGKKSLADSVHFLYNQLRPHRYGGVYSFQNPILYIRDPVLIKNILAKDFHHFYDRSFHLVIENEPLTRHLFNLTGNQWKNLRMQLSPTFSSAKIKLMFPLVKECVEELVTVLDEKMCESSIVDMKDLLSRYTIDVISSCAFGLHANSLRNSESEFRKMGLKTFEMTPKLIIRSILFAFNPHLANFLRIKSISDEINNFFINFVKNTISYRTKNKIERNDFSDQLINLFKINGEIQENDKVVEFMAAQCFVFFLAGYETSSNVLSFAMLEIAKNYSIQQKLQQEVDTIYRKYSENITYETMQESTYMDQVLAETMRMYPAVPMLLRTCTENYRMPGSDFVVEEGTLVYIPIYGLHHDAEYFPEPQKFDPERFSECNKHSTPQYAYLPFGKGPKICIGIRFGLMQLKLVLASLVRNYHFEIAPNMELPVKLKKHSFLLCSEGGIWLNCSRRNSENEISKNISDMRDISNN